MSAVEQTGPPCIIDLAPRWAIDAVLFLTLSAVLLAWGMTSVSAPRSAVGFIIAAAIGLLVDRMVPALTDPATIADESVEQPIGAYQQARARYLVAAVPVVLLFAAIAAAFSSSPEGAGTLAGLSAAIGFTRLIGVHRLRRLERDRHIRLSARAGIWRRGPRTFYTRPDLGI